MPAIDDEVATAGQTVDIVNFGAMTTSLKNAGSAYTVQAPSDAKKSVTLNKQRHFSFVIEDTARLFARPDYLAGLIDKGVKQMAADIDADIAALYSGFSQSINATGGLAQTNFTNARRLLSKALAPQDQRYAVLHPDAAAELLNLAGYTNRDYRSQAEESQLVKGYLAGGSSFAGFEIYEDQNIVQSTNNKNLFFHREAIALVVRPLPAPDASTGVMARTVSVDGMSLRVMMQYDISQGGYQVVCDCLYGVAELRDAFGVTVLTAAAS